MLVRTSGGAVLIESFFDQLGKRTRCLRLGR
jgi:hypothetical protein